MSKIINIVRAVILFFSATALTGCTSFMEGYNRGQAERQAATEQQAQAIIDGVERSCLNYGFKRGTDGFAGCKERGINNVVSKLEGQQAAQQAAAARADQEYWRAYRERMNPKMPTTTTTNCNPTGNGNYSCSTSKY
ncbi:MAG TPA: hypothetical protein PLU47_17955 [Azonexus sp.]|nr:hypothetical protein [Azonexus sp.]